MQQHHKYQNLRDTLKDRIARGELSAAEANVQLVLAERYRLTTGQIPRDVRSALNAAVKDGRMARMPKEGAKPECYYNPEFRYLAVAARNEWARDTAAAVAKVMA